MRCEINPTPPTLILLFLETVTKQICCLHGHEVHPRSRSLDGPLPQQPPTPSVIIRSSAGHSTVRHPMPAHDRYAICMSFGSIYRPRHTLKHREPLERCMDGIIAAHSGRLKSRLKAKCARRRGESTVLFKNEHAAQARARWHVRGGRAGLGRRTKNIGFHRGA